MASFHRHLLLFSLLVTPLSSTPIQARESKFFSKFTHHGLKNSVVFVGSGKSNVEEFQTVPIEAPTLAPTLVPSPNSILKETGYNYGLYGHETAIFPAGKETYTTTTGRDVYDLVNEELDGVTNEKSYQSSNNNNNKNGYTKNGNNDGYYYPNGYVLASESYEEGNQNQENNGYTTTTTSNNNGYENERQGMSDTRFMEGSKYYYDVKNKNYYSSNNGYEPEKVTTENHGYYGDSKGQKYVFDTMEEYEKYEESHGYGP